LNLAKGIPEKRMNNNPYFIVIGTDHELQKTSCKDSGLDDLLRAVCNNNPVCLIAEEVSTSEEVETFGRVLIGQDKWLSIDMNEQERRDAGIYDFLFHRGAGPWRDPLTGKDTQSNVYYLSADGVREDFWLKRIFDWCQSRHAQGTVIITCGHNHAHSLGYRLAQSDYLAAILEYLPEEYAAMISPLEYRP
jgi:hypothetical protein